MPAGRRQPPWKTTPHRARVNEIRLVWVDSTRSQTRASCVAEVGRGSPAQKDGQNLPWNTSFILGSDWLVQMTYFYDLRTAPRDAMKRDAKVPFWSPAWMSRCEVQPLDAYYHVGRLFHDAAATRLHLNVSFFKSTKLLWAVDSQAICRPKWRNTPTPLSFNPSTSRPLTGYQETGRFV